MAKRSAGLVMYRRTKGQVEVLLVHPGGPFWARKDLGAWSIPKGQVEEGEQDLEAACREFQEETGFAPVAPFLELGTVRQAAGKVVAAWAFEGDADPAAISSITCSLEWPPRSGVQIEFPEVDRGAWFSLPEGRQRILKGQVPLLDALSAVIGG